MVDGFKALCRWGRFAVDCLSLGRRAGFTMMCYTCQRCQRCCSDIVFDFPIVRIMVARHISALGAYVAHMQMVNQVCLSVHRIILLCFEVLAAAWPRQSGAFR